jgi:DNA polymerase-3 subunit epsilon
VTWTSGPFLSFDVESTGVSVEDDRIVTAAVIEVRPGYERRTRTWLLNPGIDIPEEATAVHGISTAEAQAKGQEPAEALSEIAALVCMSFRSGTPLVAMNASFDLTMLDRELLRHDLGGLADRLGGYEAIRPVLDPYVIDREVDKYRKGKRTLTAMCEHYGVVLDNAHSADADALAAGSVLHQLATRFPDKVGSRPLDVLHDLQVRWHRERQADFAEYLRKQGKDASDVDGSWPIRGRAA